MVYEIGVVMSVVDLLDKFWFFCIVVGWIVNWWDGVGQMVCFNLQKNGFFVGLCFYQGIFVFNDNLNGYIQSFCNFYFCLVFSMVDGYDGVDIG